MPLTPLHGHPVIQQALHAEREEGRPSERQLAATEGTMLPAQHVETSWEVPVEGIPETAAEASSFNLHVTDSTVSETTLAPDHVAMPDHGADVPQQAGQAVGEPVLASEAPAQKEEPQQQLQASTPPAEVIQMALGDYSKEDVDKR